MANSDKSDHLVVKTHHQGEEEALTVGDQRVIAADPAGVTITRGLPNQIPPPADPEANALLEAIFAAHRDSDGLVLVELADRFRTRYGWHLRVEWLRVLGLEITLAENLLREQQVLLDQLHEAEAGRLPAQLCPMSEPLQPSTIQWALGANHLNMMEWLWKAGRFGEALLHFQPSHAGLSANNDNGRRIERLFFRASCNVHLGQIEEAKQALESAQKLDESEFQRALSLFEPKMPELKTLKLR